MFVAIQYILSTSLCTKRGTNRIDCRGRLSQCVISLTYPRVELHEEGVKAEQSISRLPEDSDEVDVVRVPHDVLVEHPGFRPRFLPRGVRIDVVVHDVKRYLGRPDLCVPFQWVKEMPSDEHSLVLEWSGRVDVVVHDVNLCLVCPHL